MTNRKPYLREVKNTEAIVHALWEAHACIGQWAFCACLAMLRKAIDLWSADYRDRHKMNFDREAGERDNIYWRLQKIADQNPLYAEAIHQIIDALRIDANDAVHECVVCSGGQSGTFRGEDIEAIQRPYERLHSLVTDLVRTTTPDLQPLYSDRSQWKK